MLPVKKIFVIAGLGNLDKPATRHSVGMLVVDRLCTSLGLSWTRNKDADGLTAVAKFAAATWSAELHLLKSKLPMNLNGYSVSHVATRNSIPSNQVYLIHDELDMMTGAYGMRDGGSARGHNGVKSVMNSLQSKLMPRLRIGIGRPADVSQVGEYVLKDFTVEERWVIDHQMDDCLAAMLRHMAQRHGVTLALCPVAGGISTVTVDTCHAATAQSPAAAAHAEVAASKRTTPKVRRILPPRERQNSERG